MSFLSNIFSGDWAPGFNAVVSGLSLLQQGAQNRSQSAIERQQLAQQQAMLDMQEAYQKRLTNQYNQNVASGVYNPAETEKLINDLFQNALKTNLGNSNAALKSAGYRVGDSRYDVNNRNISEKSALAQSGKILDVRQNAQKQQYSDLQATNPLATTNQGIAASQWGYNNARSNMTDPSQLLQNILESIPNNSASTPMTWVKGNQISNRLKNIRWTF